MAKVALTSTGGRRKNGLTWSMGGWGRPAWTAAPCALFSSWLKALILWTSLSTDSIQTSLSRPSNGFRFAHYLWTKSNFEPFIFELYIALIKEEVMSTLDWFRPRAKPSSFKETKESNSFDLPFTKKTPKYSSHQHCTNSWKHHETTKHYILT